MASRTVRPALNASAIGGEYLSAASFLGIAGLVLAYGADMLWYPVGWTAGYLVLLVLVAAPLRRSGAYTLPDFAEARLDSRRVRASPPARRRDRLALPAAAVPGRRAHAALATGLAPGWAAWSWRSSWSSMCCPGGMRSVTFVQAFQYWLKLTALLVPAIFLLMVWLGDGAPSPADPRSTARTGRAGPTRSSGADGRAPALRDVLPDPRDVPGHDGPAPRGRPLLHQPRRPRRPPYDAGGARPARPLLRPAAGVRRPRPHLRPRPGRVGALRPWCSSCRAG